MMFVRGVVGMKVFFFFSGRRRHTRCLSAWSSDVCSSDLPASWPEGCEIVSVSARTWDLRVRGELGAVVSLLSARPVADLDVQMPHLEEVLKKYYASARSEERRVGKEGR